MSYNRSKRKRIPHSMGKTGMNRHFYDGLKRLRTNKGFSRQAPAEGDECPDVIMADGRRPIQNGGLPVPEEVVPDATVTGFAEAGEASGFMLKPITVEGVRERLENLRYSFRTGDENA